MFTKFSSESQMFAVYKASVSQENSYFSFCLETLSTGTCRLDSMDIMPSILFIVLLSEYLYILLSAYSHMAQETKKQSCQFVQIDSWNHLQFTSSIRIV